MSSFSAIFRLKAVDDGMSSTIDAAKAKVGGIGGALGGALKNSVGRIFSASAAMTMLKGTMEEVLNRAKQYNNLGMRMGLPATEVAKLDKAAEHAGINVASLGRGMMLMQKFGAEGLAGTTERARVLTAGLSLTREELEKMKQGGKAGLALLADKLKAVGDEGARDAMGIKILGEKYFEMKQMIEMGGDAILKAGDDQATWNEQTQDSLSRMQRAWANMWNELSVATADFMSTLEPLIGILRFLINVAMPAVRLVLWVVGQALLGIGGIIAYVNLRWQKLFGDKKDVREAEAAISNLADRSAELNKNLKEGIKRDLEGAAKGARQTIGLKTGDEGYKGKGAAAPITDSRTMEEKEAYEKALKEQRKIKNEKDLEVAQEEEKLRLMAEQLMLMKEQEKIIKEKHPTMFEKTAEWLELQNKIEDQQKKMRKERRDQDIAESKREYDITRAAAKRRLALLKETSLDEAEIFEEEFKMKQDEIVRLGEELYALQRDEFATNEDRRKKVAEIAEAMGEADVMLAKREESARGSGVLAKVDSLQKVGGGGATGITPLNVAKQSLSELQKLRRESEVQTDILSKRLGYNLNNPVYGR